MGIKVGDIVVCHNLMKDYGLLPEGSSAQRKKALAEKIIGVVEYTDLEMSKVSGVCHSGSFVTWCSTSSLEKVG